MPAGHTTKRTLTPYRADLLRDIAAGKVLLDHTNGARRHQVNEMIRAGWVQSGYPSGGWAITDEGREILAAHSQ